jgi:two-component system, chemotaxis family, CheB/CheR fusion protein
MADKKHKIYRKKMVATPVNFRMSVGGVEPQTEGLETLAPPVKTPEIFKAPAELQREADRLLLARYAPPSVVINDHLEILQSRSHTGTFLELPTGNASLNLLKMARSGLQFELQGAIDEVRKTGIEAERHNIQFDGDGLIRQATIRVNPFMAPVQNQQNFLIVFELQVPESAQPQQAARALAKVEQSELEKQVSLLKQELGATKEYLQSIIETQEATNEELQSANEEIQSGNEELQSTNEELQTSKEELESANEELHTVNEEMQHRNELLAQLNNDLTNLLNSVNIAIVMVGLDLSVRRFTSQATTMFGLVPGDVGRPIPRLKLKIDSSILEQMMLDVIGDVQAKQFRVQDREGKWCNLRITPYRTLDNRIDGAVLSVLDRTAFDEASTIEDATDGQKPPVRKRPSAAKARSKVK